jgi:hypothetical protein
MRQERQRPFCVVNLSGGRARRAETAACPGGRLLALDEVSGAYFIALAGEQSHQPSFVPFELANVYPKIAVSTGNKTFS